MSDVYIVVGNKPWNRRVFEEIISKYPGQWRFVGSREQLTLEMVQTLKPRYIFFLHWSWKVPDEIVENFECVCFHMADVPYGRGGSPLQNLIVRGHRHTKLTALRMVKDFDAGPIYLKEDLCLEGNAEEIYIRASYLSAQMIRRIIEEQPEPQPQMDEKVVFKRRKLEQTCVKLFKETWSSIRSGRAPRIPQDKHAGTYHRTRDVERIDHIGLDQKYTARELIDIIQPRTFPPYPGAYFIHQGRKVYLRIQLLYEEQFGEVNS